MFAAFAALFGAWSLATPLFAGTDESAHSVRAAAAARGEWVGDAVLRLGWHMDYRVPEAYARTNDVGCFGPNAALFAKDPASIAETPVCLPSFAGGGRLVKVGSYEFRGLPAYYSVIGLPTLLVPDGDGVYLMRLLSALGAAALAASAVASVLRRRFATAMVVGVLVALTPEVVYLAGLVNPNGLEIVATITLFATVLALAHPDDTEEDDDRLVLRAGIAGVLLGGRARTLELWRRVDVRRWLGVAAGVVVLHGLWIVTVALGYGEDRTGHGLGWAVGRWDDVLRESVGVLGSNDIRLPAGVYAVWGVVALGALGLGLVLGTARHRLVAGTLLGLAALLAVGVDGFNLPPIGFDWQGRYGLPLVAGAVLVALDGVRRDRVPPALAPRLPVVASVAVVALLGAQLVGFVGTAHQLGLGRSSDAWPLAYLFDATWDPAVPPLLLLAAFAFGLGVLGTVAIRAVRGARAATVRA